MKVKEMKEQLEKMDDETELMIEAPNAPPWITVFSIKEVPPVETE